MEDYNYGQQQVTDGSGGLDGIEIQLQSYREPQSISQTVEEPQSNKGWERNTNNDMITQDTTQFCNKYVPAFISLKVIGPFFDVSTKLILKRVALSMLPFSSKFIDHYQTKPDLFAPFWILTTLVATLFISSNIYCFIAFSADEDKAAMISFKAIPIAASIIYATGIGLPLLMKILLNLYGNGQPPPDAQSVHPHTTVFQSIGIYCYSFISLIVASILCGLVPFQIAHWIFITLAGIHQIQFLFICFWFDLKEQLQPKMRWIAIAIMSLIQIGLLIVFKFYFFPTPEYSNVSVVNTPELSIPLNSTDTTVMNNDNTLP